MAIGQSATVSTEDSVQEFEATKNTYLEAAKKDLKAVGDLSSDLEANKSETDIAFIKETIHALEKVWKKSHCERIDCKKKAVIQCLSTIEHSSTKNSLAAIDWLNDDKKLSQFIKLMYKKFGKINIIKFIQNFIDELPTCRQENIAETTLLEVIKEEGDRMSLETFYVLNALRVCSKDFQCFKSEICPHVFDKCVDNSWEGVFQAFYTFSQAYPTDFRNILGNVIKSLYARNIQNFENVFQFIIGFSLKSDEVLALTVLFNEMNELSDGNGSEILMLAYRAKLLKYGTDQPMESEQFGSIERLLPLSIQNLVRGSSVLIYREKDLATERRRKKRKARIIEPIHNMDYSYPRISRFPKWHNFFDMAIPSTLLVTFALGTKSDTNRVLSCPSHIIFDKFDTVHVIAEGKFVIIITAHSNHSLAYTDNSIQSVKYENYDNIKSDNKFHWQAILIGNHVSARIYFKNRNSSKILIESKDTIDDCNIIKSADFYTNQEESLWNIE